MGPVEGGKTCRVGGLANWEAQDFDVGCNLSSGVPGDGSVERGGGIVWEVGTASKFKADITYIVEQPFHIFLWKDNVCVINVRDYLANESVDVV
eukprot:14272106-Ditylum_brightwellii.AAC.1